MIKTRIKMQLIMHISQYLLDIGGKIRYYKLGYSGHFFGGHMSQAASFDNSNFKEELQLQKWLPLVRSRANAFRGKGLEADDLIQEGLIGLLNAIRAYDTEKGASFKTFAYVCITNHLSSAVEKVNNNVETVSIDDDESEAVSQRDLQELVISREYMENWLIDAYKLLSPREEKVLKLYLSGCSYRQMSEMLEVSEKAVDNALCRAKYKLRGIKF